MSADNANLSNANKRSHGYLDRPICTNNQPPDEILDEFDTGLVAGWLPKISPGQRKRRIKVAIRLAVFQVAVKLWVQISRAAAMDFTTHPSNTLGADIRALRKSRRITLEDMAVRLDRSVGWLSQVERDLSTPSIDDLHSLSTALNVPLSLFFGQSDAPVSEQSFVVRKNGRRAIGSEDGLTESLLSPDLTDSFEVIHCTFAPKARSAKAISRQTQEVATVIKGALTVWIEDRRFEIATGDSFRVRGEPYRWENPHNAPATAIWVISPPVY